LKSGPEGIEVAEKCLSLVETPEKCLQISVLVLADSRADMHYAFQWKVSVRHIGQQ
jgi:hypothetical protein